MLWDLTAAERLTKRSKLGLKQLSDSGEIEKLVDEVPRRQREAGAGLPRGQGKAFNSLVGQVMKATRGQGQSGPGERAAQAASSASAAGWSAE